MAILSSLAKMTLLPFAGVQYVGAVAELEFVAIIMMTVTV